MVLQETQRESTSLGRGEAGAGGCGAAVDGAVGEMLALACGGGREAEVGRRARSGREGRGSESRKSEWGESGMFHKKPSPPCSVRMRASAAVGAAAAAQTATKPASGGAHV